MYETIDALQECGDWYVIDYMPCRVDDPRFLELEGYLERTWLPEFADRVTRIILKIVYLLPCAMYLTEPATRSADDAGLDFDTDIRRYSPERLAAVIGRVVLTDFSSVQILCDSPRFLISVCGGFSVTAYGADEHPAVIELLRRLAAQEGLFLRRAGEHGDDRVCDDRVCGHREPDSWRSDTRSGECPVDFHE